MDPFQSIMWIHSTVWKTWKNQFASVAFGGNSEVCNIPNGTVIELPVVVSINGFPHH